MANPHGATIKWDDERKKAFLEVFATNMNIKVSADTVGISAETVRMGRKKDSEFEAAYQQALQDALDNHENILRDRVYNGITRHEYYKGEVCGEHKEYDNGTARWLLQVHNREKYCVDKQDINLTHSGGVLIIPPGEGSVEGWMEKNATSMEQSSEDDSKEDDDD